MKRLLVLGAGTAGTMVVNKLRPRLAEQEWKITVVDQSADHHYQPGYLFMPFGEYTAEEIVKPKRRFIPEGVDLVLGEIERVVADESKVLLVDGTELGYDQLVIATGTTPRPDETPGMAEEGWRDTVHDFYTLEGAQALGREVWAPGMAAASSSTCDGASVQVSGCPARVRVPGRLVLLQRAWEARSDRHHSS
jgi:sulfide:quinone oxidoreductase